MHDYGLLFSELTASEIFGMLIAALPDMEADERDKLRIVPDSRFNHGLFYRCGQNPNPMQKTIASQFQGLYRDLQKTARPQLKACQLPTRPLIPGVILLFLAEPGEKNPVHPIQNEAMLICDNHAAIPLLYYKLCRHATHTYLALCKLNGNDKVIFHIKDESKYGSSFQSAAKDELFDDCDQLCGYEVGDHVIFLPKSNDKEFQVDLGTLNSFYRLLLTMPDLFHLDPEKTRILAAFAGHAEKGYYFIQPDRLTFRNQLEMMPPQMLNADVVTAPIEPAEQARAELQTCLEEEHWAYYKLQLLPARYRKYEDNVLLRLMAKKQKLEDEIELMLRKKNPPPLLFRYEHEDFHILTALLRRLEKEELRNDSVLYGFQYQHVGHGRPKKRLHYIYLEQAAFKKAPDPTRLFSATGSKTRVFELDYSFNSHYRQHARGYLFTPRNTMLYPSIHPDEADQVDRYLSHLVKEENMEGLSEPIIIFDGVCGVGARLEITLLDKKNLTAPKACMGWLNDCLVTLPSQDDPMIARAGSAHNHIQIAGALESKAEDLIARFQIDAARVKEDILKLSDAMVEDLEQELTLRLDKSGEQARRIEELTNRLEAFTGTAAELDTLVKRVEGLNEKARSEKIKTNDRIQKVKEKLNHELKKADGEKNSWKVAIANEVRKLKKARKDMVAFFLKNLYPFFIKRD